ncbi:hypothetical protein Rhe02_75980 [Rhizocola hellebori]|uniref:Protein kinase domain-containing protein n=1 Tax=Rhizocola hellebori TaxID=1392758 RepID=A0A8J3QHS5_9ACTN|nr:protein kinase [Rhizocola hellebori]GIH09531.1 hypothetical protein Rhe02_75980 [Rhizocola hellebori]
MGSVYLGRRDETGPLVAVKMIRKDLSTDPDFRRRFRSEVARAQQVPAFCTAEVLDADPDHEPPYLVVEFVNGPSLARVVQNQGPLSPANLHGLALGVATALTAIHGAGIVHRDLKPANVLLAPGAPKVIDFGIARAAEATGSDTAPHQLIGTIPYMAPERLDQQGTRTVSPAADIFAWGAVVAYAGTGRVPFGGGSAEAAARILTQPPDLTGLTGTLRDLVELALSKDPKDRPAARELLDRLVAGGRHETRQGLIEAGSEQAVVTVANVSDPTRLASIDQAPSIIERNFVPEPPRRERKPGRALISMLAATVVILTATVVGIFTGVIPPFSGRANEPPQSSSTPQANAPTTSSSSPTVSASTSPTATPGLAVPAFPPVGIDPEVRESLTKDSFWFKTRDELQTTCLYTSAGYQVRSTYKYTYKCHSDVNAFKDFALQVEVSLRTTASCAAIWFRFDASRGYLLSICPDRYELFDHGAKVESIKKWPQPIKAKESFKVGIHVQGSRLIFFHNGQPLFEVDDDYTYVSGTIGLGVDEQKSDTDPREVIYKDITIWRLP